MLTWKDPIVQRFLRGEATPEELAGIDTLTAGGGDRPQPEPDLEIFE